MAEPDEVAGAIKAFESGGLTQRRGAVVVLGQTRDIRVVPPLIQALGDEDGIIHQKAMEALVKLGGMAVESLIGALKHSNSAVRWRAAEILGQIGNDAAVGPLSRTVKEDKDRCVRGKALKALEQFGDVAIGPLIESLKDEHYYIRSEAIEALKKFGGAAIGPLIESLKDRDWYVRWQAVQALDVIGDDKALERLELCKYDESKYVREAASQAIDKLRKKRKKQ